MFHDRFARQNRLRTSIRVSPDFILHKHRSPSFGSQDRRYNSNLSPKIMIGRWCRNLFKKTFPPILLSFRIRVFNTQILARILDSLVRVSRRADDCHFVNVLLFQILKGQQTMLLSRYLVGTLKVNQIAQTEPITKLQPTLTFYTMHISSCD